MEVDDRTKTFAVCEQHVSDNKLQSYIVETCSHGMHVAMHPYDGKRQTRLRICAPVPQSYRRWKGRPMKVFNNATEQWDDACLLKCAMVCGVHSRGS